VTIAAGFNFAEGVLFCADTRFTGAMALYETKIFTNEYPCGAKSVIAFSGSVSYAKMTIDKIHRELAGVSVPHMEDLLFAIEQTLIEVHAAHITPHPDRLSSASPGFSLLIGLWSPRDGLRTYYTEETAIPPFQGYQCIGSGEYLAHYIIRPRYGGATSQMQSAFLVAITALERIKGYDAHCGGISDFVILSKDGTIRTAPEVDITRGEAFSRTFHTVANQIYTEIAQRVPDDAEVERYVKMLVDNVRDSRRELEDEFTRRAYILKALSGNFEIEGGDANLTAKPSASRK
jgi:20S proteasome alpha/beta subunit